MNRWLIIFFTAAATLFGSSALPSDAEACGNSMHRFKERRPVQVIHNAWYEIREKNYEEAIAVLSGEFSNLDSSAKQLEEAGATTQRALHAMAVAVIRTEGTIERSSSTAVINGNAARRNVIWATRVLQELAKSGDEARSHHAEALALEKERRSDARVTLEALATKQLIPDAEGWRLLAALRTEAGASDTAALASAQASKLEAAPNPKPSATPRKKSRSRSKAKAASINLFE